ncbi:hypothetical protein GQ53DRAFT_746482, partial [Thozetella sp. PMI_491]
MGLLPAWNKLQLLKIMMLWGTRRTTRVSTPSATQVTASRSCVSRLRARKLCSMALLSLIPLARMTPDHTIKMPSMPPSCTQGIFREHHTGESTDHQPSTPASCLLLITP